MEEKIIAIKKLISENQLDAAVESCRNLLFEIEDTKINYSFSKFEKWFESSKFYSKLRVEIEPSIRLKDDDETSLLLDFIQIEEVFRLMIREKLEDIVNAMESSRNKILFLSSSPIDADHLNLEKEHSKIVSYLIENKVNFEVIPKWKVNIKSIPNYFTDIQPKIVHISVHGNSDKENLIYFEDEDTGAADPIDVDSFYNLFETTNQYKYTQIVFINACNSYEFAKAISKFDIYAVGLQTNLLDKIASTFSSTFYRYFANPKYDVEMAFFTAKNTLKREYQSSPALFYKGTQCEYKRK